MWAVIGVYVGGNRGSFGGDKRAEGDEKIISVG